MQIINKIKLIVWPNIRSYLRYFMYIVEHKKNVFIECFKAHLYIHAITHDLSKLLPSEFFGYANKFYGGDYCFKWFEVEDDFERAWLRHKNRNPHHWDYWVQSNGKTVPMPSKYIKQMVCDLKGMARKFGDTAQEYYEGHRREMNLHPLTAARILEELKCR